MTTRTTTQTNTPEDKRAIYVRKFSEKADTVPDTIHKAWDAMTTDEQATVIWYQVRFSDSITRAVTAYHAIGCYIKANPDTFTTDEADKIWKQICG